jgi:hypothetical protein
MQLGRRHRVDLAEPVLILDVAQHDVDRLQRARRLLGDRARLRVELAAGLVDGGVVAAHDVERREGHDHRDEERADPRHASAQRALRFHDGGSGSEGDKRRTALSSASRRTGLGSTAPTPSAWASSPCGSTLA